METKSSVADIGRYATRIYGQAAPTDENHLGSMRIDIPFFRNRSTLSELRSRLDVREEISRDGL